MAKYFLSVNKNISIHQSSEKKSLSNVLLKFNRGSHFVVFTGGFEVWFYETT